MPFRATWLRRATFLLLVLTFALSVGCRKRTSVRDEPEDSAPPPRLTEPELSEAIAYLSNSDPDERFFAAVTLVRLCERQGEKAASAVDALRVALRDSDENTRGAAAVALGWIGAPAAPAAGDLGKLLSDPSVDVRSSAAVALGRIGPQAKPAVAALTQAVKDREESVRLAAVAALGKIGPSVRQ